MPSQPEKIEQPFPSATWEFRRFMVRRPAGGQTAARAKRGRFWGLPRRDARQPITMSIKLRGGPEMWVEVHARGRIVRYPGYVTVAEVLLEINQQ